MTFIFSRANDIKQFHVFAFFCSSALESRQLFIWFTHFKLGILFFIWNLWNLCVFWTLFFQMNIYKIFLFLELYTLSYCLFHTCRILSCCVYSFVYFGICFSTFLNTMIFVVLELTTNILKHFYQKEVPPLVTE